MQFPIFSYTALYSGFIVDLAHPSWSLASGLFSSLWALPLDIDSFIGTLALPCDVSQALLRSLISHGLAILSICSASGLNRSAVFLAPPGSRA